MASVVIFDVDGTLVDSVDLHAAAWQEALAGYGHQVHFDLIRAQIGKGGDQLLPVFLSHAELQRYGDELKEHRHRLWMREYLPDVRPFAGVRGLVSRILSEGRRVGVATSARHDELSRLLEVAGVADLVNAVSSADDVKRSKPAPDVYLAAWERLQCPDRMETVAVGDSPYDAESARRAGLLTLGVLSGGFSASMLEAAGCAALYSSPQDLLARYDESPIAMTSLEWRALHDLGTGP